MADRAERASRRTPRLRLPTSAWAATTDEEAVAYKKWECKRRLIKLCFTAWMHGVIMQDSEAFDSTDWGWQWVGVPLPTGGPTRLSECCFLCGATDIWPCLRCGNKYCDRCMWAHPCVVHPEERG